MCICERKTVSYLIIFRSCHDWGTDEMRRNNHSRVSTINEKLRSRGLCTWFDERTNDGFLLTSYPLI